jgi:hypothetical protein
VSTVAVLLLTALGAIIGWELAGSLFEWNRCIAIREKRPHELWGRCDLRRGHQGDHELHRHRHRSGVHLLTWSTAATGMLGDPATFVVVVDDRGLMDETLAPERRPRHRRRAPSPRPEET